MTAGSPATATVRALLARIGAAARAGLANACTTACDDSLSTGDGQRIPLRLRGVRRPGEAQPLVLHFHAGAFIDGDLARGGRVAELLAEAGARVVSVAYPLAPASPFPQAVDAGRAALDWVLRHRARLAGSDATLWLAGEEAGGNLAAAVSMMARDARRPTLAGRILLSPMLDMCVGTASLREAQAGPAGCRWADGWRHYLARPEDALHPYATPARALRLEGLPPTLLVSARDDPLRDEALAYAERLRAAGVPTCTEVLAGPTGWPASYMSPPPPKDGRAKPAGRPEWADALVAHFRAFFTHSPVPRTPS